MLKTFQGGVHPAASKNLTCDKPIKKAPLPRMAVLPLLQHTGAPSLPVVSAGERVKAGQLIAISEKFVSSPVHASICGTVIKIEECPHPLLGSSRAVMIKGDGTDEADPSIEKRFGAESLSRDEIRKIIRDAGIVGLGGAAFPTHVKLTPPEGKKIDSIILNGAECEPYLTCDHRLMIEKSIEVIKGLKVISKLTGASNVYIAIESNKLNAARTLRKAVKESGAAAETFKVILLKVKYPQGAEKNLIKAVLNRETPPGKLPFDVGCVVSNVGTAVAIYEAVFEKRPLYERVVTLSGSCLKEPSNLLVRIGTPLRELVDICGGFINEPAKVICGGPMMGLAQFTLDIPIIKGTSGILFLSEKESETADEGVCIRCAKCVDVCPMNLIPTEIARLVKKGRYSDTDAYNIKDCVECGACSYECPAKIPLLQWIKIGKQSLLETRRAS